MDFHDRNVIVTGGTRGIGAAITRSFLDAGAYVAALYASDSKSAAAVSDALDESARSRLRAHKIDVSDYDQCADFYQNERWRVDGSARDKIDILVNNAGIRLDAVVGMMPSENWRRVIDINLTGSFNMAKHVVARMSRARYGRIINIISPIGRFGFAGQANYAASKAGQEAMTRSLAKEVARRGITVNAVSPGFIETDLIADLSDQTREEYIKMIPVRRFGRPEEIARIVLFLAAQESAYITGATFECSGGL